MGLLNRFSFSAAPQLADWMGLPQPELAEWDTRAAQITDYWEWYTGKKLEETDTGAAPDKDGKLPLKYPLQINPINTAARLHSFALWGEVPDTADSLVKCVIVPPEVEAEGELAACRYCGQGQRPDVGTCTQCGAPMPVAQAPKVPIGQAAGQESGEGGAMPKRPAPAPGASGSRPTPPERTEQSAAEDGEGETEAPREPSLPLPAPSMSAEDPAQAAAKKLAQQAERAVAKVLYENNARAMLVDAGLASQPLGGIVWKVGWEDPQLDERPTGIRIEYFDPRHFHARWRGRDYWNLTEAWIKLEISAAEAAGYGVQVATRTATYVEYWSRDEYWIKVNGQQIEGGPNPFKFVPFIYVPHERVNDFWGRSIVPEVIGLTREINARMADMGDAVHLGVNSLILLWNLKNGYPIEQTLPNGQPFINLGRAISQGDPQPGGVRLDPPNLPTGAETFNNVLLDQVRTYLLTPAIAYGHEEGSQRSGQTLYQRMWPLLAHVRAERTHWTTGLNLMAEMILAILAKKHKEGITPEHLHLRKKQLWAEMVPVDREALVNEMVQRKSAGLVSAFHALQQFGDVDNIPEELGRIRADAEQASAAGLAQTGLQLQAESAEKEKDRAFQSEQSDAEREHQAESQALQGQTQVKLAKMKPKPGGARR